MQSPLWLPKDKLQLYYHGYRHSASLKEGFKGRKFER